MLEILIKVGHEQIRCHDDALLTTAGSEAASFRLRLIAQRINNIMGEGMTSSIGVLVHELPMGETMNPRTDDDNDEGVASIGERHQPNPQHDTNFSSAAAAEAKPMDDAVLDDAQSGPCKSSAMHLNLVGHHAQTHLVGDGGAAALNMAKQKLID
jgi:hypothetical protein